MMGSSYLKTSQLFGIMYGVHNYKRESRRGMIAKRQCRQWIKERPTITVGMYYVTTLCKATSTRKYRWRKPHIFHLCPHNVLGSKGKLDMQIIWKLQIIYNNMVIFTFPHLCSFFFFKQWRKNKPKNLRLDYGFGITYVNLDNIFS